MKPLLQACVILFLIGISLYAQYSVTINIAANDLIAKGIEQSSASIISDRLRSELISTGVFQVMERNEMNNILKEQGFQKTGACDESSCLVEVGQLLGVERMVAGTAGKIGTLYTLSLRMINVATGRIMFTVDEDYEGDIKGLLSVAVGNAARKVAAGAGGELLKAALTGKTGDLHVSSEPPGATIEIDGKAADGRTPLSIKSIAAGEHRVIVRKGDYFGSKTVTLEPDDLFKISIVMERGKGTLKLFATPDGAAVGIDGERKGTSPCKLDMPAGEHRLRIENDGFFPYDEAVLIRINETNDLSVSLKPAAYLTVTVPGITDARILINNADSGWSTIEKRMVDTGECEIKVEKSGFDPWTGKFLLEQGKHTKVAVELLSVFGTLAVSSTPEGAQVFLNDNAAGITPYNNLRLIPGNYTLKVVMENFNPVKENIIIEKNRSLTKTYALEKTGAYLDSVKQVNAVSAKKRHWARRIVFCAGTVGSAGVAIYYNIRAGQYADDQRVIQKNYNAAGSNFDSYESQYTSKADDARQARLYRNLFLAATGLFLCGFGISIPF